MSDLLKAAETLLEHPTVPTRAAAVLARRALEEMVDGYLGLDTECSIRARLLLLEEELGRQRARELAYVYSALSRVCHYHPYELPPTESELRGWFKVIQGF